MNMKKIWILPALLLITITAQAGLVQPAPVVIDFDNNFASGDLISARNSENEFELIGCGIRAIEFGGGDVFQRGFCQARLAEGTVEEPGNVVCFTENVALMEGINILSDSSFVTFSWTDDGTGALTCTRIGSSTQSFYLGKDKNNLP